MTSFFANLFLSLQQQIKNEIPEIKWTDLDIGQLEHYQGERPALVFPCILIDFPQAKYTEEGALAQWGETAIQFRLGFSPFASANSVAPDISKENALTHFEIEQKVFSKLHGWQPADAENNILAQPLIRLTVHSEERNDAYRVRVLIFTTAFEDMDAMQLIQQENPSLNIIPG